MSPGQMKETIHNARYKVISIGREADLIKFNGDDSIRVNIILENANTGVRVEFTRMLLHEYEYQYHRMMEAFKNQEPIQVWLTTDFIKEGHVDYTKNAFRDENMYNKTRKLGEEDIQ